MITIATVLAVVIIVLLSVVVFVSFAIYMKLIENIADNEKKGVPRMENPPPPPNRLPKYNFPPPPPCRSDLSLYQRLNDLSEILKQSAHLESDYYVVFTTDMPCTNTSSWISDMEKKQDNDLTP